MVSNNIPKTGSINARDERTLDDKSVMSGHSFCIARYKNAALFRKAR